MHVLKTIFYSGCYVVLDSGFCVLKTLIALKKKGVFAATLIKKCPLLFQEHPSLSNSWTRLLMPISGMFDNVKYNNWCMKVPENVMTIMATGGGLREGGKEVCQIWTAADGQQKSKFFKYAKPFDYHF